MSLVPSPFQRRCGLTAATPRPSRSPDPAGSAAGVASAVAGPACYSRQAIKNASVTIGVGT